MITIAAAKRLLMAGAATFVLAGAASAQSLTILAHPVFRAVIEGSETSAGGDTLDQFRADTGAATEWLTLDIGPLHDRLLRELNLSSTSIDVAFMLDRFASSDNLQLFDPLDSCLPADDLAAYLDDLPPTMRDLVSVDGKAYLAPYRHATHALYYNEALFEERGITSLPTTIEEVVEVARKLTFTRADGSKVHGLVIDATAAEPTANLALAFGGAIFDAHGNPAANSPQMVRTLQTLRDLYNEGVLPTNTTSIGLDENITQMRTGVSAMTIQPFARLAALNDPGTSQYPGKLKPLAIPASPDSAKEYAATTVFWSAGVPRNSENKELACNFIRTIISEEGTIRAAQNGNGPMRISAYDDARVAARSEYSSIEQAALRDSEPPLPASSNSGRMLDLFVENLQAAILGLKTAEEAANDLQDALKELP
jgi:multiple sugar transport system substrate-binding protein